MISTTTKHALRALVVLAGHQGRGPVSGRELAEAAAIPPSYLAKVLQAMRRAGLVRTARGVGGGYRLAVDASDIRLVDVARVFEGVEVEPPCVLGCPHPCSDATACGAHAAWRRVRQAYLDFLQRTTLEEICAHGGGRAPCERTTTQGGGSREGNGLGG